MQQTILHAEHCASGAMLVNFSGWMMPLHYGSQLQEHHAVRQQVGLFDVSHMGVVDVTGVDAKPFLRYLLANDVAKLDAVGKALYTCMLNEQGGILDDLLVYFCEPNHYRLVVNAATREKDLAWLQHHSAGFDISILWRQDLAIIAVQGPKTFSTLASVLPAAVARQCRDLKPFQFFLYHHRLLARTGYTGEDGVEIILPNTDAVTLWQQLVQAGARPCGLGARDTLRLEAGLNLYGVDMDESVSPLESNLSWTVAWQDSTRDFIGKEALLQQKNAGPKKRLIGVVMQQAGVLRNHQKLTLVGDGEGEITSGSFSPTLGHAIGLARVPVQACAAGLVERRGQMVPVSLVKPPFVRKGLKSYTLSQGETK